MLLERSAILFPPRPHEIWAMGVSERQTPAEGRGGGWKTPQKEKAGSRRWACRNFASERVCTPCRGDPLQPARVPPGISVTNQCGVASAQVWSADQRQP